MIEMNEVMAVLDTAEGKALMTQYTMLYMQAEHPEHIDNEVFY